MGWGCLPLCLLHWRKHPTISPRNLKINGQARQQRRWSCDEGRNQDREQGGRQTGEKKMAKVLFFPASGSIRLHGLNSQPAFLTLGWVLQ